MAQQAMQARWPLNGIVLPIKAQLTTNTTVRNTWKLFISAKCNELLMEKGHFFNVLPLGLS